MDKNICKLHKLLKMFKVWIKTYWQVEPVKMTIRQVLKIEKQQLEHKKHKKIKKDQVFQLRHAPKSTNLSAAKF